MSFVNRTLLRLRNFQRPSFANRRVELLFNCDPSRKFQLIPVRASSRTGNERPETLERNAIKINVLETLALASNNGFVSERLCHPRKRANYSYSVRDLEGIQ